MLYPLSYGGELDLHVRRLASPKIAQLIDQFSVVTTAVY